MQVGYQEMIDRSVKQTDIVLDQISDIFKQFHSSLIQDVSTPISYHLLEFILTICFVSISWHLFKPRWERYKLVKNHLCIFAS